MQKIMTNLYIDSFPEECASLLVVHCHFFIANYGKETERRTSFSGSI